MYNYLTLDILDNQCNHFSFSRKSCEVTQVVLPEKPAKSPAKNENKYVFQVSNMVTDWKILFFRDISSFLLINSIESNEF